MLLGNLAKVGLEKFIAIPLGLIFSAILARHIAPEYFGIFVFLQGILMLIFRLNSLGFTERIIYSENINRDYEEVFRENLTTSLSLFLVSVIVLLFSEYFQVGIIMSFGVLAQSIASPIRNYLHFKEHYSIMVRSRYLEGLSNGIIAVVLESLFDLNLNSLAIALAASQLFSSLYLYASADRRCSLKFSIPRFKQSYKGNILNYLLFGIFEEVFPRVIDFSLANSGELTKLGFYNRSNRLNNLINNKLAGSIQQVFLPLIGQNNSDASVNFKLGFAFQQVLVVSFVLVLGQFSELLVLILYGENWLEVADYINIMMPYFLAWPFYQFLKLRHIADGNIKHVNVIELMKLLILLIGVFLFNGVETLVQFLNMAIVLAVLISAISYYRKNAGEIQILVSSAFLLLYSLFWLKFILIIWVCYNLWIVYETKNTFSKS
jgi:O-antigen/teichoic acid export membrane protein